MGALPQLLLNTVVVYFVANVGYKEQAVRMMKSCFLPLASRAEVPGHRNMSKPAPNRRGGAIADVGKRGGGEGQPRFGQGFGSTR